MKKDIINHLRSRFSSFLCICIVFILVFITSTRTIFASSETNVRQTEYKADQSLKSNARVNPSTLAMELSIPLGGYRGRGGGFPIVFDYSSKVWQIFASPAASWETDYGTVITDVTPLFGRKTAAGWTSNLGTPRIDWELGVYEGLTGGSSYDGQPYAPVLLTDPGQQPEFYYLFYVKRVQVTMPDGATHEFRKDDTLHSYGTSQNVGTADLTGTFLSVDGTRMRLELAASNSTLYLSDGSRYLFGPVSSEHKATTFIDPNGNRMNYDASNRRWTDTMGRIIEDPMPSNWQPFEQNQAVGNFTKNLPGFGAAGTLPVTFSWRLLKDPQGGESGLENTSQNLHYTSNKYCQGNREGYVPGPYLFNNPDFSIIRVCAPGYAQADPPFNPVVLTKITLPNGQNYQFKYNVFGEITKIIYPTGAYEKFLYGPVDTVQGSSIGSYGQANRGVVERWVSAKGDGTDETHWTYQTTGIASPALSVKVTTTNPDLTRTEQYVYADDHNAPQPYGFGDPKTGQPYEERILAPAPGNQVLRRSLKKYTWTGGSSLAKRDLRLEKEVSIVFEPGASLALASMSETIYDTNADPQYFAELNPKQVKTYNFIVLDPTIGQTADVDTISALFASSNLESTAEIDYLYDPNYKARNINGLASEIRIRDANGVVKAKSQILYDEAAYPVMTDVTASQWESVQTSYRGNPTTTRSWTDISANQYVETHSQYDQLGNLRKKWDANHSSDPNGYTATEYSSTYARAYPTSVTTLIPDPSGSNGSNTAFTTATVYDYNTGLSTSVTDANGQTTQISYIDPVTQLPDPLLRVRKVTAPNTHQTVTEYGAGTSESTRFIKVRSQIDETKWKESYTWFDGLGRTVKTQNVDSAGDVFVETTYNNMGRPEKATNPYRAGDTKLWTENFYDNLGRVWKIKMPDNAHVLTTYDLATTGANLGTTVVVKDPALKEKRSITNAVGQLTRVDEATDSGLGAIGNPNQPTNYSYDVLNNLVQIQQIGTNSQQCGGAVSYCTQTRTFVYDALSRLKSSSNPESGLNQYFYDANGNLTSKIDARLITTSYVYDNLNRLKMRSYSDQTTLTANYFYDNLTNAKGRLIEVDNGISETKYLSFDNMGRVTSSQQKTDGTTYNPMTYTYNLSSALIEETYPSGRVIKSTLDADGNLQQVQSKKVNDTLRNYANDFFYTPAGAVSSFRLGNGKFETTQFNSRLQPVQISLGSSVGNANLLKLNYDYGSTDNNGNVKSQQITVERSNQTPLTFNQTYTYDTLNRLSQAYEMSGATQNWKQTYTIDRFGNRRFDQANTTLPSFSNSNITNPQIDPANNRFTAGQGYTFDLAGNLLTDAEGRSFSYDAENKQKSVSGASGTIGQYFYDGDGKRVKKISSTETVIFVYNLIGKLVAEYSTQLSPTPRVQYLSSDQLATARINTDELGKVVSRSDYMPYGEEIVGLGNRTSADKYVSDDVRQGFTGYLKDDETGLDFAEARMYKKELGRFTGADPLMTSARIGSPQTWNRYAYALNNPLRYVDPDGMDVNILDAEARRLLLLTLPEKIRKDVDSAIEKGKGNLTKGSLDKIKSDDENFKALKALVDDKEITEAATSAVNADGVPFSEETHQQQYESDIQNYMKNKNVSREEAEKVISPPSNPNEINFYRGQTQVAKGYVPFGEEDANLSKSPSGNLRAVTTDRTGKGASISEENAVVTFAHELYGHAYYYRQGNKTWYGHGKVITDIEDRTRENYRNTEQKKNNPVNLKPKQ